MIEIKSEEQEILDLWNSKRQEPIQKKTKTGIATVQWKCTREINLALRYAIRIAIKNTSFESLKSAIDNYAKVCFGKEFYWTYCWTLYDFLTRKKDRCKDVFSFYRFLPDNFFANEYLTTQEKNNRAFKHETAAQKEKIEHSKPLANNFVSLKGLADKVFKRPEIERQDFQTQKLRLLGKI